MKRFIAVLCSLVCFSACSIGKKDNKSDDISLAKVYLHEKLKVGIEVPFAPLVFVDRGNYTGFDVEVINEICAILDVEPEYVEINWDDKDIYLNSGKIDLLASGFSKTPERIGKYGMSNPVIQNMQCVIVRNQERRFENFDSLKGCSIGVQQGGTGEAFLTDKINNGFNAEVKTFSSMFSALAELRENKIDAIIGDFIVATYILRRNSITDVKILDFAVQNEFYVYAFRKEDITLVNAVNEALAQMAEDGVLGQITKRWFKNNISLIR